MEIGIVYVTVLRYFMKIKTASRYFSSGAVGEHSGPFHRALAIRALPSARWLVWRVFALLFAFTLLGSSAIPAHQARLADFAMAVSGHSWDLIGWEIDALWQKAVAAIQQPADDLSTVAAPEVVKEYLARAARIGEVERELMRRASLGGDITIPAIPDGPSVDELNAELDELRLQQATVRPQVEQVVERQVSQLLAEADFLGIGHRVWPPVSFTFVEPPKKLVVSRRDRIETIYSQMLEADISLGEIIEAEDEIHDQYNAVGYVTDIGGLGAFPTMVVDRASLRWVLSTVAHEWAHNYLVFHPLGWNYFASQDLTTINESVAEIVGNEIGDLVLARYYPEKVPPLQPELPTTLPEIPPFSFAEEMRITRLEVDRLLAAGDVAGAEGYMEARRQLFVENGYSLRVLNQAYFAFHGSYGTSPSSTSPIGPKLELLRSLMPDLKSFLQTVDNFTSTEDLDRALELWRAEADVSRYGYFIVVIPV